MRLDSSQIANAFGIVGSMASSIFEFVSDGSQTKRLHPGWAAHSGIMATLLAKAGFTGPATVFEGPFGFLRAFAAEEPYDVEILRQNWTDQWQIERTAYNPYACCSYIYPRIDAVLDIVERNGLAANDIMAIDLRVPSAMIPIIAQPKGSKLRPRNMVDAQFSVYFCVAAAVSSEDKRSTMATFEDSFRRMSDPQILQLAERISCHEERMFAHRFPLQYPAAATVKTRTGQVYSSAVSTHRGDPLGDGTAFSDSNIEQRFLMLFEDSPLSARSPEINEAIRALEHSQEIVEDGPVRKLANLLRV